MHDLCLVSKHRKNQINALARKTETKTIGAKQNLGKDKCNLNLKKHLKNKQELNERYNGIIGTQAQWMFQKLGKSAVPHIDQVLDIVMDKMAQPECIQAFIKTNTDLKRAVRIIPPKDKRNNEGKRKATDIDANEKEFSSKLFVEKGTREELEQKYEKGDIESNNDTFRPDMKGAQIPVFTEKSELEPVERSKKKMNCFTNSNTNFETTEESVNPMHSILMTETSHADHCCSSYLTEHSVGCHDKFMRPKLGQVGVHLQRPTLLYPSRTIYSKTYIVGMVLEENQTVSPTVAPVKNNTEDSNNDKALVVYDLNSTKLHSSRTHQACITGIPQWIFNYDPSYSPVCSSTEILKRSANNYHTSVNDSSDVNLRLRSNGDLDVFNFSPMLSHAPYRNLHKSKPYRNFAQRQKQMLPTGTIIPVCDAKNNRKQSEMQTYITPFKSSALLLLCGMNYKDIDNDEMVFPTVSQYLVNSTEHNVVQSTMHLRTLLMLTSSQLQNTSHTYGQQPIVITLHEPVSQIPIQENQRLSFYSIKVGRMSLLAVVPEKSPFFKLFGHGSLKIDYCTEHELESYDNYISLERLSTDSTSCSLGLFASGLEWESQAVGFQHNFTGNYDDFTCLEEMMTNGNPYSLELLKPGLRWEECQAAERKYKNFDNCRSLELSEGSGKKEYHHCVPEHILNELTTKHSHTVERKDLFGSENLKIGFCIPIYEHGSQSSLFKNAEHDVIHLGGISTVSITSSLERFQSNPIYELESQSSLFQNVKHDDIPLGGISTDRIPSSLERFQSNPIYELESQSLLLKNADDDDKTLGGIATDSIQYSLESFQSGQIYEFKSQSSLFKSAKHDDIRLGGMSADSIPSLFERFQSNPIYELEYQSSRFKNVEHDIPLCGISTDSISSSLERFQSNPIYELEYQSSPFKNAEHDDIPMCGISTDSIPSSLNLFRSGYGWRKFQENNTKYEHSDSICSLDLFGSGTHVFQHHLPERIRDELSSWHFIVDEKKGNDRSDIKFEQSLLPAVVTADINLYEPELQIYLFKNTEHDYETLKRTSTNNTFRPSNHLECACIWREFQAENARYEHSDNLCSLELFGSGTHEVQHNYPGYSPHGLIQHYSTADEREESDTCSSFELYGSGNHDDDADLLCDGSGELNEKERESRNLLDQNNVHNSNRNVTVSETSYQNPCSNPDLEFNGIVEENSTRDSNFQVVVFNRSLTHDEPLQSEIYSRYRSSLNGQQNIPDCIPRGGQAHNQTELFFNNDGFSLRTQSVEAFSENSLVEINPIDLHENKSSVNNVNKVRRHDREDVVPPVNSQGNGFDEQAIRDELLRTCMSKVTGGDRTLLIDFLKALRKKHITSTPCGVILNRILQSCINNGTLKYTKKAHEREWKGGFGRVQVCEAVYNSNSRNFSYFKFIRKKIRMDKFNDEEILVNMDHGGSIPGLLSVYGVIIEDDTYISVLQEYFPGETLQHFIEHSSDDLTVDTITDIVFQVFRTISSLHSEEIVHWDIKGSNIMVRREGGNRFDVRVIDLGSAKPLRKLASIGNFRNGTWINNPPEWKKTQCDALLRNERIMKAHDSWCLGLVLYCLLKRDATHICNYNILGSRFRKSEIKEFVATEGFRIYEQINTIDQTWDPRLASAVHLLSLLLECEPYKRITVTQALDYPLFADRRRCTMPTVLNDLETNVCTHYHNIAFSQENGADLSMDLFPGNRYKKITILYEGKYLYLHYFEGESVRMQDILRDEMFMNQVEKSIDKRLRDRGYCLYDRRGRTVFRVKEDCELNLAININ